MKFRITKIFHHSQKVAIFQCDSAEEKVPVKWIKVKTFSPWLIENVMEERLFEPYDWYPTTETYINKNDGLQYKNTVMVLNKAKFGVVSDEEEQQQKPKTTTMDFNRQFTQEQKQIVREMSDEQEETLIDWGD